MAPQVGVRDSQSTLCCVTPQVGVRDSQSTLCCVAPRVRVRDSQSTLFCVAPRVGVRDSQSTLFCVTPQVGVRDSQSTSHVYKVIVAVDMLGNIIWICPLAPWTSADVLIWDGCGPSRTRGDFCDFEVGGHDGAYKGRIHVIVPFIGRKNGTLTARQQGYNDVHGWYRARIEQLFARLWHWGLVRNIWRGGPNELHQSVRILLHFIQFCIRRQVRHPPYGPWKHVPPQVWTDQSNSAATQDKAEDEAEVCVLCCQRRSTVAVCDECKEHYCNECIDTHTYGTNVVC